jgi:hypothetical protein
MVAATAGGQYEPVLRNSRTSSDSCFDVGFGTGVEWIGGHLRQRRPEHISGQSILDVPFTPDGIPLLSRFAFQLADEEKDNHLHQILIDPGLPPGRMRIDFSDDNPRNVPLVWWDDDDYFFNITHFNITDSRVQPMFRSLDFCSVN